VWGYVHEGERTVAAYFVHWTVGSPDHFPNIDFLFGSWGNDEVNDRVLTSWVYNPHENSFMVIDSGARPAAKSTLCSHALRREEVLAAPGLKGLASRCLDAVWLQDERVRELRAPQ